MEQVQHYFIFREPEDIEELKALLLLRYSAFMASRLNKFIERNSAGIDLDCYDLYSHHFGLFEHMGANSRPAGYVRMVTDQPQRFRDELFELSKRDPTLYENVNRIPEQPFPLMSYCPYGAEAMEYYLDLKSQGKILTETSRLSVDPSVRGASLIHNFVSAIHGYFIALGYHESLVACARGHEPFYRLFGGWQFPHTDLYDAHGVPFALLLLGGEHLPDAMKERVGCMQNAYERFGRICYDPSHPDNFNPPLGAFIRSRPVFWPVAA